MGLSKEDDKLLVRLVKQLLGEHKDYVAAAQLLARWPLLLDDQKAFPEGLPRTVRCLVQRLTQPDNLPALLSLSPKGDFRPLAEGSLRLRQACVRIVEKDLAGVGQMLKGSAAVGIWCGVRNFHLESEAPQPSIVALCTGENIILFDLQQLSQKRQVWEDTEARPEWHQAVEMLTELMGEDVEKICSDSRQSEAVLCLIPPDRPRTTIREADRGPALRLCELEWNSNWERRPLRGSQLHHAACQALSVYLSIQSPDHVTSVLGRLAQEPAAAL